MSVYVFDIDGTITNVEHRRHHILNKPRDWNAFNAAMVDDTPNMPVVTLLDQLWQFHTVILCSGRSDDFRSVTVEWLQKHHIGYEELHMRKSKDFRDDAIIKSEMADKIIQRFGSIDMAFEDRDRVVRMWRDRGIPCAQVNYGDF